MFESATRAARAPHWYVEGRIPDTLDGRFAVLATIIALVMVRLEQDGTAGDPLAVALTERFIEVMESEHRELGLGDPTLGKTVRKLVGLLARRTRLWRETEQDPRAWTTATRDSLYKGSVEADALRHSADALMRFTRNLRDTSLVELERGRIA